MKFIIAMFAAFLLFGGIYDTYTSWTNPEPVRMTVAEYAASDKSQKYVVLTDAAMNLFTAVGVISSVSKKVSRLYIPIESEEFAQKDGVSLLLNTVNSDLLAIANEFRTLSEGEQLQYFVQHVDTVIQEGELSGRVMSSSGLSGDRAEEIQGLVDDLEKDFYVVNHGGKPNLARGLSITGGGLLLLLLAFRPRKKTQKAEQGKKLSPQA